MAGRQLLEEPGDRRERRPAETPEAEAPPTAASAVLWMQRTAGNAATGLLLRDDTKTAPAKPKTDEEIWEEDWANKDFEAAKKHFEGEDRPVGDAHFRYMTLAPLYKAKGIDRPLQWVKDNIEWGTFYGHGTYMHKSLKTKLKTAETALKKDVPDAPFKKLWAFNPRTQTGGDWSNHADGKAIDFDEVTNPKLFGADKRGVISALTGIDISAADPGKAIGMSSYDASREASQRFQARYTDEGIAERIDEISDEEVTLGLERDALTEAIDAIPTGKKKGEAKPTEEQKADLKRLKQELAAKKAELQGAAASRKALEKEAERREALEKAVTDALTEATELSASVDVLEAELSTLEGGESLEEGKAPLSGKALTKEIDKRKKLIKQKTAQWKLKQQKLEAKMKAQDEDTLQGYADVGFLDLDERLVNALTAAGLGWGGDYSGAKDFMHFEV